MNIERYNIVRDSIQTGDVIAFSGKGQASDVIKWITMSKTSHVGIAMWSVSPADSNEKRLFIIESTTLNSEPDVTGEYRRGVQMIPMGQRLEGYQGHAWWLPLALPLSFSEKLIMTNWLFQREASRVDYDTAQAIAAGIDPEKVHGFLSIFTKPFVKLFTDEEDLRRLFCSELVTKALQVAGRVDPSINPSEQTPADVVSFNCLLGPVPLYIGN